jgi:hypothetical protein
LYKNEIKTRKRKLDFDTAENINIVELESKKRGRKTLLGDELDSKVKLYLQTLRSKGGVVNTIYELLMLGHFQQHIFLF